MQKRMTRYHTFTATLLLLPAIAWLWGLAQFGATLFFEANLSQTDEAAIAQYVEEMFFFADPSGIAVVISLLLFGILYVTATFCVIWLLQAIFARRPASGWVVVAFVLLAISQVMMVSAEAWDFHAILGSVPEYRFGNNALSLTEVLVMIVGAASIVCLFVLAAHRQVCRVNGLKRIMHP